MKVILFVLVSMIMICSVGYCDVLTSEQMGFMELSQYGYYNGLLGIFCGIAFVMGLKQ